MMPTNCEDRHFRSDPTATAAIYRNAEALSGMFFQCNPEQLRNPLTSPQHNLSCNTHSHPQARSSVTHVLDVRVCSLSRPLSAASIICANIITPYIL